MSRDRACAALIVGSDILMVQHVEQGRAFWTLPGGGIESEETAEACATRELFEETGVRAHPTELIWKRPMGNESTSRIEYCFLMKLDSLDEANRIFLGVDPEEAGLAAEDRILQGVSWKPLLEMQRDPQVAQVLQALK